MLSGLTGRLDATVGGKARLRVVLLLGGVLSLQSADTGTVGALAPQLERAFHIGNTEVGLLITAIARRLSQRGTISMSYMDLTGGREP